MLTRNAARICLLAMLAACQPAGTDGDGQAEPGTSATDAAVSTGSATGSDDASDAKDAAARKIAEENDLYTFGYAYPAPVAGISGLKAVLDGRIEEERAALTKEAGQFKAEAQANGFPYRQYSRDTTWSTVADLPGWLSLSAQSYVYTGGAHGMTNFDTLLWDKQADRMQEPTALFTSTAALSAALRTPFCDALDKEREKRRGAPVVRSSDEMFNECIDPLEQTVILGSSNGKTFNRVGLLVPPYNAGPYAEGSYEVTLPVTQAVIDVVKPEYRDSFSIGR